MSGRLTHFRRRYPPDIIFHSPIPKPTRHATFQHNAIKSNSICHSNRASSSKSTPSCASTYVPKIPTQSKSTSWERSARAVKNTNTKNNKYIDQIRDEVVTDPAMHVKTIEDEVRAAMGKALGMQADKILALLRAMERVRGEHEALLMKNTHIDENCGASVGVQLKLEKCMEEHEQHRKAALKARWELVVHRQAVGFVVDNHRVVHEMFPIPPSLVLPEEYAGAEQVEGHQNPPENEENNSKRKVFGTQLDWWQRVGRWR